MSGTSIIRSVEVDRIADPWGERTPYGRGEPWPVRVDSYLADGVAPEDVERWVQAASILHSNGDALDIAVRDNRIVGVRGPAGPRRHLTRRAARFGRTASARQLATPPTGFLTKAWDVPTAPSS